MVILHNGIKENALYEKIMQTRAYLEGGALSATDGHKGQIVQNDGAFFSGKKCSCRYFGNYSHVHAQGQPCGHTK